MTKYQNQAKDFLAKCNATMRIIFVDTQINPEWDDNVKRNKYHFILITPLGTMEGSFWNSAYNKAQNIKPTAYDILACLEKYDVGTIDDFVSEFGYEVHKWSDVKRIENTYVAVVQQYNDLCRIFTPDQMELLRRIW